MTACNNPIGKQQPGGDSSGAAAGGAADSGKVGAPAPKSEAPPLQKTVTYKDHKFTVLSKGDENVRDLILAVTDMKGDTTKADSIVQRDVKGHLNNVAVADLDKDGHPEIYCFSTSSGTDKYGLVYGFVYDGKSAIRITPPELDSNLRDSYKGGDTFYLQAPYLVRSFPVNKEADPNIPTKGQDANAALNTRSKETKKTLRYRLQKSADGYYLQQAK
ncbi:hypothetical protein CK934_21565 [Chitinophaga sp. MD30]|nr:hypothetical protein CK934_21565 [Chitinophaga sp. MD30]